MAVDRDQMIADLRAIISTRPVSVTVNGTDYTGLLARCNEDREYLAEGAREGYRGTLSLVYDDIEDETLKGREAVTISGTTYRVGNIVTDSWQVRCKLVLTSLYQA